MQKQLRSQDVRQKPTLYAVIILIWFLCFNYSVISNISLNNISKKFFSLNVALIREKSNGYDKND